MITQITTLIAMFLVATTTVISNEKEVLADISSVSVAGNTAVAKVLEEIKTEPIAELVKAESTKSIPTVPFYSQFSDISAPNWKKVSCGIADLAMIIEFYKPGSTTPDKLLKEGINSGAYISSAGWSHAGLIKLSNKYGLDGYGEYPTNLTMDTAFSKLETALEEGPVIASVHYKFDPRSTIPHLVVVNGVEGDIVHYNDPAEKSGGGEISIEKFKKAWKKRFIVIRPK